MQSTGRSGHWTLDWKLQRRLFWRDESRFLIWKSVGRIWVWQLPGEQHLSDCIVQSAKFVEGDLWYGVVFQELGYNF